MDKGHQGPVEKSVWLGLRDKPWTGRMAVTIKSISAAAVIIQTHGNEVPFVMDNFHYAMGFYY